MCLGVKPTPEMLRDALKAKHYRAVAIVHNETSTGVENPVKELAAVVHEISPDTLIMVDAVFLTGRRKNRNRRLGFGFCANFLAKMLSAPTGMSFAAVSERAMAKAETVPNRGWY